MFITYLSIGYKGSAVEEVAREHRDEVGVTERYCSYMHAVNSSDSLKLRDRALQSFHRPDQNENV